LFLQGGHIGDQLALASHSGRFPGSLGNHPGLAMAPTAWDDMTRGVKQVVFMGFSWILDDFRVI